MTKLQLPLHKQCVAIIGCFGFKGRTFLKFLEENPHIKKLIVIDRKKPNLDIKKGKFYKVELTENLLDERLVQIFKQEKVSTVIHTALPNTPPRSQSLVHEIVSIASMYIANACAAAGVKKFILASSTDVYGALPNNPNFLTENSPLRGGIKNPFIADKIDAEKSALKLAIKHPEMTVTILRSCHILGPTIQNYKTRYITRPIVPTILGYDPLIQFIHEEDILKAYEKALTENHPGVFNLVGPGVLPLHHIIKIAGKLPIPIPESFAKNTLQLLWYSDTSPVPASHLNFLKYLCIADGSKAEKIMKFKASHSTRETLISFVGANKLRDLDL